LLLFVLFQGEDKKDEEPSKEIPPGLRRSMSPARAIEIGFDVIIWAFAFYKLAVAIRPTL
jgi:hypothetical protein